jgi:hypothetical protein
MYLSMVAGIQIQEDSSITFATAAFCPYLRAVNGFSYATASSISSASLSPLQLDFAVPP